MREVLKRIAVNGLITAALLGAIGFAYAELAAMWLAGSPVPRAESVENAKRVAADEALRESLRIRVPLTMALWGFSFVALGELVLYWWRGNPTVIEKKSLADAQPDNAEQLLEELLAQADAAMAKNAAVPTEVVMQASEAVHRNNDDVQSHDQPAA